MFENAVFEKAPVLPNDPIVPSTKGQGVHVDGHSNRGDIVEYLHFDETENVIHHELVQDVEPILDSARRLHLDGGNQAGKSKSGEWYHAARVPQILVITWLKQRGLTMQDFKGDIVKEFLNDSNHKAFRIYAGRV
jgi:hypothetical protein